MKGLFILAFFLGTAAAARSQQPVTWKFSSTKIGDKSYEVHFSAVVDQPWHIYSQSTPEGGPQPTRITIKKTPLFTVTGKAKEIGDMVRRHEEVFGIDVFYYEEKVDFVQVVTLKAAVKTTLAGSILYMVCNDHACLPPTTIPFSIPLK